MTALVALNSEQHQSLCIKANAELEFAASQHLLSLKVQEVGQAGSSFPVFLMKDPSSGVWRISAVASFAMGTNLFVESGQWLPAFKPLAMQTFPFYLMKAPGEEKGYTIGINPASAAFSEQKTQADQAIFSSSGKASAQLMRVTQLLEASIEQDIHTYQFGQAMQELGLVKAINLVIHRQDGSQETLQGLCTIDEDKLNALSGEQLKSLSEKGYLSPIYAMLTSIYQLNALIRRNNRRNKQDARFGAIKEIKIAVNSGNTFS
ncbi:SapC family protein [Thalassotalea euphylliae]|uniref:SapC family protein n=1 Tax=Thalassotalea euphylliae TaxID=1655234 RepID=A0A3E0TNE8_9GAMM|nr:SapC family protein [Thalassotalea euphylliae]REL25632.1 SapC family protein [Thalassotalea euphylliae]